MARDRNALWTVIGCYGKIPLSAGLRVVDGVGLTNTIRHALDLCVEQGFKRSMIALLTFRGRESSAFWPYTLRTFTGTYDLLGSPIYSDGELTIQTVYRFKGQSAPAVVLTEIDFETLDELATRKLFVGATRATMKLVLVMSERAAGRLMERLG